MKFINTRDLKWAHVIFQLGIIEKALNAVFEIIGSGLLLFLSNEKIVGSVSYLLSNELNEDPRDRIANYLLTTAQRLSFNEQIFGGIYLLSHGVIKIFLIVGLVKRKLWAYPLAMTIFAAFILYQLYRFSYDHSLWLLVLSVFDLIMIGATYLEWKRLSGTISGGNMLPS